jgi:TolB-like protein
LNRASRAVLCDEHYIPRFSNVRTCGIVEGITMEALMDADGTLRFGSFELDVRSRELRTGRAVVRLQEQPFEILRMMLERPGSVVTRDELRRRLWPDGTFVDFEHSLNAAVRRLRLALNDDADVPRFIETIHKRGYRFIALNETYPQVVAAPATIAHIVRKRARLAVLPFGPYDAFTEGLTEEAITQLTQCAPRSIGVLARTSVERAQREGGSAADIGRALSADYLVDGTVRRDGDRVRISAQLIESEEETHLWASTYERQMTDALTIQTEVAAEIAHAVTAALAAER